MNEISKWIKKVYGFKEFENNFSQMWCISNKVVGFLYKDSYFCNELRKRWEYTPHTFQYVLDYCNFEGDLIIFNDKIEFSYLLLKIFIWMFNPKHVILEVNLNNPLPMIVSAPHIPFEMVLAPRVIENEIEITK